MDKLYFVNIHQGIYVTYRNAELEIENDLSNFII